MKKEELRSRDWFGKNGQGWFYLQILDEKPRVPIASV